MKAAKYSMGMQARMKAVGGSLYGLRKGGFQQMGGPPSHRAPPGHVKDMHVHMEKQNGLQKAVTTRKDLHGHCNRQLLRPP